VIHRIEEETKLGRWDVRVSRLCDWCEYKSICPAWKHPAAMEALAPNEYLRIRRPVVQKYADLDARKRSSGRNQNAAASRRKLRKPPSPGAQKENVVPSTSPNTAFARSEENLSADQIRDPFAWELLEQL